MNRKFRKLPRPRSERSDSIDSRSVKGAALERLAPRRSGKQERRARVFLTIAAPIVFFQGKFAGPKESYCARERVHTCARRLGGSFASDPAPLQTPAGSRSIR